MKRKRAFTFVELLVALLVLAAFVGFALPLDRRARDENRKARVFSDLASLAGALSSTPAPLAPGAWLTCGTPPAGLPAGPRRDLRRALDLPEVRGGDPWGRAYVLFVPSAGHLGLVVCAGPDGRLDTPREDSAAAGDDLALPFRNRAVGSDPGRPERNSPK